MKAINNHHFDELFKISIYRDMTEQLLDRRLITNREYEKIIRRIDAMEDDLIKPDASIDQHQRNNTVV